MLDKTTKNSHMLERTARWMAAVRAQESEREDRLFNDPWAAALAGPEGQAWIKQRTAESVIPVILRTRFFDDYLQQITRDYGIRQIVLMAAGLDTRAFRLGWPADTKIFELDQAPVLAYKEALLQETATDACCARRTVAVDLTAFWESALVGAGFDPYQPAGWLLEGFLFYLPDDTLTGILERVLGLAAPESAIGFDIVNSLTLTHPLTREWVQMQAATGAPWQGTMDDPEMFLAGHGWQATLTAPGAPDANHQRWPYPVLPVKMPEIPHLWFVTGRKC